jgi:predicted aspartyl protease
MVRRGDKNMGRVTVEVDLVNHQDTIRAADGMIPPDQVRRVRITGVVDTAASYLVVPRSVARQLGLPSGGKAAVRYADRRRGTCDVVEDVTVEVLGRHGTFRALVEPKRDTVLLGAIVLEDLDLLVDCRTQTLHPRDPKIINADFE